MSDIEVKDINGNLLSDGDAVILTQDLKLKGTSRVVKRGTVVKSIRLTDDPEYIDCKIEGTAIALKTCFIKLKPGKKK